jgi:general secretion pathway protein J
MTAQQKQRGFTLLEIVIAIGVFAVLSTLAYGGMRQVLLQSHQTRDISREFQNLQYAFALIQQDIQQIVPREVRDDYGNTESAVMTSVNEEYLLQLTRNGWPNPAEQARSTLQRVRYVLDQDLLLRQYWYTLDRAPASEPISMPLLEHLKGIELQFLDHAKEWHPTWPAAVSSIPTTSLPLPLAVEITLDTERWGKISRVFAVTEDIPATTPTAPGLPGAGTGSDS